MNLDQLFSYTLTNIPTNEEFDEISEFLAESLRELVDGKIIITKKFVEPKCSNNTSIFIDNRNKLGDFAFTGIINLSLREHNPSIIAILLVFSNSQRISQGKNTILESYFTRTGWSEFVWAKDIYDEWECDRLEEDIVTLPYL